MPRLDVSSVLLDPMFLDRSLTCVRNTQTVDDEGMATNKAKRIPFAGVATAESGNRLTRTAEGSRVEGSIRIITRFRLQDGKQGLDADIIEWQGRSYTVVSVDDYSSYGRGFVSVTCELIPFSGGPLHAY